ncbi:MAG: T9SS type A sorting domain-containing protein [Bacteroidales bacterium]|nr:T9SS type A sorting domain-containing protein [Bacteroidales bacterium]
MKKTVFVLFISLLIGSIAAQVPRDKVVVEIATGTWCQYCPGAAMGADDLVENGHEVAIVEYHNGDAYTNVYSNARNAYYNVTGYPSARFDGVLVVPGGSTNQSMYPNYLPRYNQRIAISSSFTIDIEGTNSGLIDYDVNITIEKVASAGSNIVLHAVVTESEIEQNWQGQTHLSFVERLMAPNQYGTSLDFSGGNTAEVNINFSLEAGWVSDHCELVVFIQDLSSKEILQGSKRALTEFESTTQYDASIQSLFNVGAENCTGFLEPNIIIRNNGNENMTSLDVKYHVNNGTLSSYSWAGNLGYLETDEIHLPEITFFVEEENFLQVYTENPNGNPDQYPQNDTASTTFGPANTQANPIHLLLRLDGAPEETTFDLLNSVGDTLYSGGPYPGQPFLFIMDTFNLPMNDCYIFTIRDTGGNGLCCENGVGFYKLTDSEGQSWKEGMEFGSIDITQFEVTGVGIPDLQENNIVTIYPNPFTNYTTISISLQNNANVVVKVYNLLGNLVQEQEQGYLHSGEHQFKLDRNNLERGTYFIRLFAGNQVYTQKIAIN